MTEIGVPGPPPGPGGGPGCEAPRERAIPNSNKSRFGRFCSAVHWHSRILGFTPRPWPGNPQNPAPEGRIPALGTGQNLCFSLEGSTISAPGWQAGWGTSLAPCGCPVQRSKFSDSQFTPSNGPLSAAGLAGVCSSEPEPQKSFQVLMSRSTNNRAFGRHADSAAIWQVPPTSY